MLSECFKYVFFKTDKYHTLHIHIIILNSVEQYIINVNHNITAKTVKI